MARYPEGVGHTSVETITRSLYLIGIPGNSMVKIGISDNPTARLRGLARAGEGTLVPCSIDRGALMLLHQEPGGRRLELALHRYFAHRRVLGEWFDLGPVAVPLICAVVREMKRARAELGYELVRPRLMGPELMVPVARKAKELPPVVIEECAQDACRRPQWLGSSMCRAHDLDAWLR
jgi:hypothetical protein